MRFHILYNVIIEDIYFVMTKEKVEIIIKRYYYISRAMKENAERAVFYIGKRKHVIPVTDEIKIIFDNAARRKSICLRRKNGLHRMS